MTAIRASQPQRARSGLESAPAVRRPVAPSVTITRIAAVSLDWASTRAKGVLKSRSTPKNAPVRPEAQA